MLATVLMALQTFYNFAARAEKHRTAGARYKAIIRRLERHFTQMATLQPEDPQLKELQGELDDLEENAEVIIHRIYNRVEKKYSRVVYVSQAAGLLQPPSDSMNET